MKVNFLSFVLILLILSACTKRDKAVHASHNNSKEYNPASAVPTKYSLAQFDNAAGLSNSSVNCIFQDSENLTWIGTWDGLNRYDGTKFKIFRPHPNKNSLSNQVVLKVGEDKAGHIWILTMHGINCYDKKTDTFSHYYFSSENKPPVSESEFNIAFDADKNVYCAVKDWGIGYFDGTAFRQLETKRFRKKTVEKLEFDDRGRLMVLFDDSTLFSILIQPDERGKKYITSFEEVQSNVSTFSKISDGRICIVSGTGEAILKSFKDGKQEPVAEKGIESVVGSTPLGILLSGKSGNSLINPSGAKTTASWFRYLQNHKISTVVYGNEGIIWAGTDGDGVLKIYPQKKSFSLVSRVQIPELDGGIVRAFLKDSTDAYWIATKGKGLFKLPQDFYLHPEKKLRYDHFDEDNSVINNSVYALCKGADDFVLIGTDGTGLTVYDTKQSKFIGWNEIKGAESCPYFKSVYAIHQDKAGFIWLGTNGYGMMRFKLKREGGTIGVSEFAKYSADAGNPHSLSSNIVFSIIPRNDNQLWIGTRLGGLNLFNKPSAKFNSYKNIPGDSNSLSNNDILCMAKDYEGRLWIGTSFGLNMLQRHDDNKAAFKSYTVDDGLPNNTIHGIVPVKNSNLWVSTNSGLSTFSIPHSKFINYTMNEGLQNNEFADGAYYSDTASGYIFMGGIKGFNYFLPEKIKESATLPNLLIDEISGQNQALPYYQGLVISPQNTSHPGITLKHDQNFFDIHIRALTYTNSEKCRYAYQLAGFDKEWNNIGNRQTISFTNVPKGKYSLWLRWTNSEGIWSRPIQAIDIKVMPVWWQSDFALIIYLILAVSFVLFVRSYNLKRQSLKQNILIRRNEEVLHENKLSFFTNIAHEFLTPLTLIVGPAQKLAENTSLDSKNTKYMHMIQRNASRLLFLTQQLLEFRKAEHDYLNNSVKNFDLTSLAEQIAELFDDWAIDKNISYKLDIPSQLNGWYDKDKLEKIVFNLMSNAFKYTPKNGKIHMHYSIENRNYKTLNITISNTGEGIPKDKLDSIFDRFILTDLNAKPDTEMFRTGIGLAYVKRLVTVLKGEILVSSEANAETVFTVLIPCEKAAFAENEVDNESTPVFISQHLANILETPTEKPDFVPQKISKLEAVESKKKKILIAEDENEIHAYLKDLLSEKYDLITAYDGAEALKLTDENMPDLIISDIMMPLMDGVELCRRIKTELKTCHIPFIMLTAKSSVIHRIEGLESGANSYIPKPFYPDHLLVRIQKLLEEKELIIRHFAQDTLVDNLQAMPIHNEEKAFIKSVIELVRKNVENEHLDSKYVEKSLGISESQLYRKTKEIFGLAPGDLIRTIRLKHAAELLRKNELTVSEVCYKSGFNNRSYFYREFKKMYNTTPKNYQIDYKNKNLLFSK